MWKFFDEIFCATSETWMYYIFVIFPPQKSSNLTPVCSFEENLLRKMWKKMCPAISAFLVYSMLIKLYNVFCHIQTFPVKTVSKFVLKYSRSLYMAAATRKKI